MTARGLPSDRQLDDLLAGLDRDQKRLAERLREAIKRDRAGTSIPDGYPRGSGFEAGGGMRFKVDADEHEGESTIELTSVELAIEHRVFSQKSIKDHHRDLTRGACSDLESAVRAFDELHSKLARIDNLIDENPNASSSVQGCRSHARLKDGLNRAYFEPVDRESGGRDGLCRWCYGWASEHDRKLPPIELVERLIRQGRITSRDIDEVAAAKRRAG